MFVTNKLLKSLARCRFSAAGLLIVHSLYSLLVVAVEVYTQVATSTTPEGLKKHLIFYSVYTCTFLPNM